MKITRKGDCIECGKTFALTGAGIVRLHFGPTGWHERCEGSSKPPRPGSEVVTETKPTSRAWWWGVTTDKFVEPQHRSEVDAYRRAQQLQAVTPRSETVRIYTFELGSWTLHDTLPGRR